MTEYSAPTRRPTIKEVARLAGVSHQTVSRYLKSRQGLRPATLERIDVAVEELGYRPNLMARSMRTRRTGRLAVVMPVTTYNQARLLSGALAAAHEAGRVVEVVSVEGSAATLTERVLELAGSGQVDGVLSLTPMAAGNGHNLPSGAAVVVTPEFDDAMRSIGELTDATPVTELIERLANLGHRRFLHVAGDQAFASARARKVAYLEAIDRFGLESVGVSDGDWSGESGVEAILQLDADRLPTAVIAANDVVASGVVRGAYERGLDVPGDLSVTGWDDNELCRFLPPSLTTVRINLEGVGRNAALRLIKAVGGPELEPWSGPVAEVIWRESTAPPRQSTDSSPVGSR
ncbi:MULTISPECIES: LacI family DNA-binding transcriptional regulator [Kribbella]|uniref:LacI family transcriptional regulator n=1 Tax=Kribbella pratensis TaxID=2512112 RepID=A0ABY2F838_9ACTN|nr:MULTISPECIES: LacI family DNA-binding transcriptional regulator [Kribbella]TDW79423.1 LacI family transcriptional regulator [Kribbella sp. VKM Ac-2566]TDW84427.1 LacI family transcriptional regulator [Kribbella pratensis]